MIADRSPRFRAAYYANQPVYLNRLEPRRAARGLLGAGSRIEMAGHEVTVALIREDRIDLAANLHGIRAARMEMAPRRWVDRARNIARENDAFASFLDDGVRNRDRRQESLGIGVQRVCVE